jgi:hypothetical protein
MSIKKIIIFISLVFLTLFVLIYINARKENRKNYHFVISKINENAKGFMTVSNPDEGFDFLNFNSYKIDVQKEDSLVKKEFSRKVFIYRKNNKTDKYNLHLTLNESGTFPIDWQ